ncbi:ATP-binding protein [Arcobacter roscoffensis]|uniref:histidine kinase n=1 Tax=Arcobacter roscoffensis TaxID=2961520 RepID=A0ABY5E7F7_9BACT|nr:ATP-binding protein [Arcobacter roscoffensis]UTJ07449.1 ATP-binding protein [Arcobacter roscoffensis]
MKLKKLFMLLFIFNTVAFISMAIVINKYQKATIDLEDAYEMQYKSLILAHELRQSSDDLTRMARTYVITGNPMFEQQYKTVLDIRNGLKPRPKRYNGIFWDFLTIDGSKAKLDGKKVPLRELMKEANFPDEELNLLFTSQNESDELTRLEHKAMNAVKGIFEDKNGNYTIKEEPNFTLARQIMHSKEYHEAKIRIMKPLDTFYRAFENRTKQKVIEAANVVKQQELNVNVIVVLSILIFLTSFFIILFRIVYPLDLLRKIMLRLSQNDMSVELEKNKYEDEIGDMIGAVEIFKDNTTKLISSEAKLRVAISEAKSANKAKSIFLARMSHELRTPLNAILGFSSLLQKSKNIKKDEIENLNIIHKSGKHLLNIINEILELSKIEAGKIEIRAVSFDFYELIKEIDSIFSFRCKTKDIDFKIKHLSSLPKYIKADEQRLKQILINLLGNSLKFTEKKGSILVNIYEKNKKLFFEVKDSGKGIKKEDIRKIFKPFEQVNDEEFKQKGTGLGLSITKELVNLMGGDIYVKSQVNIGSQFFFSIEYEKSIEKNSKLNSIELFSKQEIKGKNKTILVVDDIKVNRDLICKILQEYDFKTFEASSGKQALALISKYEIDLVCMDILMKDLNGLETMKILREDLNIKIPIIAISANVYEEDKTKALDCGANDFVCKPIDENELISKISKYLNLCNETKALSTENIEDSFIKISKTFFELLKKYSLDMNEDKILELLEIYKLSENQKAYIKALLNDFNYSKINDLCIKYIH